MKKDVCVEKLDQIHLELFLNKIKGNYKKEIVCKSLPWIKQVLDLGIKISPFLCRSLHLQLKKLSEDNNKENFLNILDKICLNFILTGLNDKINEKLK